MATAVYDALHANCFEREGAAPQLDDLRKTWDAVAGAREFLTEPMLQALATLAESGEPNSMTFEDIGVIAAQVPLIRGAALDLIEDVEKMLLIAVEALPMAEGFPGAESVFDRRGDVVLPELYDDLRRRVGLAVGVPS